MGSFSISGDVLTARIPELPQLDLLANGDRVIVWDESTNATSQTDLQTLRSFIETGSGGTYEPIYSGGAILYIVPASAEGGDTVSIPGIAGKEFKLRKDA